MKNYKRLFKSSTDKKVMGVCGGLGEYFNIDPTLIRVLFAVLFFGYGFGFMVYFILGIALPYDYEVKGANNRPSFTSHRKKVDYPEYETPKNDKEDSWGDF